MYKEIRKYEHGSTSQLAGYPISNREELTFPSLIKRMEALVSNSGASLSLATEIRSRICGSNPESSRGEPQAQPQPNGMLEEMQILIDNLGRNLERLQDMQNAVYDRIT